MCLIVSHPVRLLLFRWQGHVNGGYIVCLFWIRRIYPTFLHVWPEWSSGFSAHVVETGFAYTVIVSLKIESCMLLVFEIKIV